MKKTKLVVLALTTSIVLAGCGGGESFDSVAPAAMVESNGMAVSKSYSEDYSDSYDSYDNTVDDQNNNQTTQDKIKLTEDKIVYHGNMSIKTSSFDESYNQIRKIIKDNGGIIDSSDYGLYSNQRTCNISTRIPAKNFEGVMDGVGQIGVLESSSKYSDNITMSYIDTQNRLESSKARIDRLNKLLDEAYDTATVLEIYRELESAEYDYENYKSRLMNMDIDVAYSYLDIHLTDTHRYSSSGEIEGDGSYWSERWYDFQESISGFKNFLNYVFIFMIYAFPYLILILVIICIIARKPDKLWDKLGRKPRQKKEPKKRKVVKTYQGTKPHEDIAPNIEDVPKVEEQEVKDESPSDVNQV